MRLRAYIALPLLAATMAFAGPSDIVFDSGSIAVSNSWQEIKQRQSGCIEQIDVAAHNTSAYTLAIATMATSGTRVAKTILTLTTVTGSGSYRVRVDPNNAAGGTSMTNLTAVPFWLASDDLRCYVTNLNVIVTNGFRVTIIRSSQE